MAGLYATRAVAIGRSTNHGWHYLLDSLWPVAGRRAVGVRLLQRDKQAVSYLAIHRAADVTLPGGIFGKKNVTGTKNPL